MRDLPAALILLAALIPTQVVAQPAPPPIVDVGLGRGVTIRTVDDDASLNIRARIQVRSTALDAPGPTTDDTSEVLIRRARLVLQGNARGPSFTYYLQLSFANLDNEPDLRLPLRDAYVTWSGVRDLNIRVGQMKVPFSRQRVVSSSTLQMVDRSIVVSELNLDRDVGIQVFSRDLFGTGSLGYSAGLFGGEGRNRLGRAAGLLYTARVEGWPFGAFDDYSEGDIRRSERLRMAFGVGVAYNRNTNRPRSTIGTPFPTGDVDYAHAGADFVIKWRGWSLTSEVMYRGARGPATPEVLSRSGWGAYAQGGVMVTPRTELSARFSRLMPRRGTDPSLVESRELGVGVSHYLSGHDLKIQGDVFQATDPLLRRASRQARLQLQLFF